MKKELEPMTVNDLIQFLLKQHLNDYVYIYDEGMITNLKLDYCNHMEDGVYLG